MRHESVILAGSPPAARRIVQEFAQKAYAGIGDAQPVGFLSTVSGEGEVKTLPTIPRLDDLANFVSGQAVRPTALILCDPIVDRRGARAMLEICAALNIAILTPTQSLTKALRPIGVADLLGQPASGVDLKRIAATLTGKRVLVTGAGGSIGSELCRQLAAIEPARLTLLDASEFNLFSIDHELGSTWLDMPRAHVLCDIRDADSLRRWFERERPEIVFHAAALKQVPMVEAHAAQGVLTNVLGTRNVADAASLVGADMVFVSTDKAVNPSSVMGAAKKVGELYCQALDRDAVQKGGPRRLVVRLGNVLGSAGSVAPVFANQIENGGPLTVTHEDVRRYFLTIPQAAGFLLQAAALALAERSSPPGVALVLEMGEPVRVVDLARDMIRLAGLRPDLDIEIRYVGLRPGEKITEQLVDSDEWVEQKLSEAVMAVRGPARALRDLEIEMDRLTTLAAAGRDDTVRLNLKTLISGSGQESKLAG